MDNIITYNDFKFPFIPDVSTSLAVEKLTYVITDSQPKFLKSILGDAEYNKLVSCTPEITPTLAHWNEFLYGKTYVNANGLTAVYPGIKNALKLYCFFISNRYNATITTSTGEASPLFENSMPTVPAQKIIDAHNEISEIINYGINSVYNFLKFNTDLFPDLQFNFFGKINRFGI